MQAKNSILHNKKNNTFVVVLSKLIHCSVDVGLSCIKQQSSLLLIVGRSVVIESDSSSSECLCLGINILATFDISCSNN